VGLGYYSEEIRAAKAYDEYIRGLELEGTTFNFPLEGEQSAI
jgi:hypothetical protein